MVYTEATIWEVWRHSSFVPLGVDRQANQDAMLGPYLIPKVRNILSYSINVSWITYNVKKKLGSAGIWTRDLLHPKQESYP